MGGWNRRLRAGDFTMKWNVNLMKNDPEGVYAKGAIVYCVSYDRFCEVKFAVSKTPYEESLFAVKIIPEPDMPDKRLLLQRIVQVQRRDLTSKWSYNPILED